MTTIFRRENGTWTLNPNSVIGTTIVVEDLPYEAARTLVGEHNGELYDSRQTKGADA